VAKLHSIIKNTAGTGAEAAPAARKVKCLPGGVQAQVTIRIAAGGGAVLIEPFGTAGACKALGRFALRSKGKTIAVGICDQTC
jgi:translation elongation factor EF-1alpha